MYTRWLHLYSILVAVGTLFLIVTGAFLAGQEGASGSEHRAVAEVGGVLIAILAMCLIASKSQTWLRRLGLIAVAGVAAETALGFAAAPALPMVSMAHAFLAPLILSAVVAIALGTSRSWQHDPIFLQDQGWPSLRSVARNTLVVVLIQVALGAAFRYGSISVMTHILGALVVVVFILTLVVLVTLMPEHPTLRPAAITLGVVTFVQIFLGLTVVSMGTAKANKALAVAFSVAHVATGAITLAATLIVALEIWRNVRPAVQEAEAARDQGLTS